MSPNKVVCVRCGREFVPKLSFQVVVHEGVTTYYCSQICSNPALLGDMVNCSCCGKEFSPGLAADLRVNPLKQEYFCSDVCRDLANPKKIEAEQKPARTIAILNQKGGTAKTTTAVCVAAGLARAGLRTLLVDLDPQGNVSVSLGVTTPRLAHHMLLGTAPAQACITKARENLDIIGADQGLAAVEIDLARSEGERRNARLSAVLGAIVGYDYIILDCAPALSILNQNALAFSGEVLIPVSCDYLALVGVKQVLRTLQRVGEQIGKPIRIAGVLPTFYDVRSKVSVEVVGYLRKSFGARTLPPVRKNVKLAEAPSFKKTIYEHASDSNGARDYIRVVEWLKTGAVQAQAERAA